MDAVQIWVSSFGLRHSSLGIWSIHGSLCEMNFTVPANLEAEIAQRLCNDMCVIRRIGQRGDMRISTVADHECDAPLAACILTLGRRGLRTQSRGDKQSPSRRPHGPPFL